MSVLAGRYGRNLLLYGGALLLAVGVGAAMAYSERFGGDNGPYLLLVALLATAVAGAILWQWRLGALLLVVVLPYEAIISYATTEGNFGSLTSGIKIIALLTLLSFALALLRDRELFERFARLWGQPLALALLAFVLWASVSILWATNTGKAMSETVTYLGLLGLMVMIGALEKRYLLLAWAGLAFSAALSVPAAAILPLPEGSDMAVSGRFGPGGAGPNTYSLIMAIAFFVAYFGWLKRHRMIAYLSAPIFLAAIFATQSRTGLIALVATPLLALFVPRLAARLGWRILPLYALGVAALAVILVAVPAVGGDVAERYESLGQIQSEDTWNGRFANWQGAYQVVISNPLVGVGAGNYAQAALEYSESVQAHSAGQAVETGELAGATHNVLLAVASELGLVGMILLLGVLFFTFRTAWLIAQRSYLGTGIFLGLIVAMIGGMTQPWEQEKIVFVLFGSVLALQLHYSARRAPLPDEQEDSH